MSKDPSPLLGYNNNIRHKSRVFHVQTEDSGVRHPHIITHLFMDGGRILKSVKTSYADRLGAEGMADVVRQMMKEQHKTMLVQLRDGHYDHLVEAGEASADRKGAKILPLGAAETRPRRGRSAPPPPTTPLEVPPTSDAEPITTRSPGPPEELTLDIEALERAAAENPSAPFRANGDLPPPPANVLRERGPGGGYRATTPAPTERVHPTSRPPSGQPRPAPANRGRGGGSSRPPRSTGLPRTSPPPLPKAAYQEARRPAAAFGQGKPRRGNSIFGEELISDKSLDEVILSYLAEDLGGPPEKNRK